MEKNPKEEIKEFIIHNFMQGSGSINNSDSLFENSIIDSFGLLELIGFIEKNFSVSISPSEATIENFDSVDKIVQMIEKKIK